MMVVIKINLDVLILRGLKSKYLRPCLKKLRKVFTVPCCKNFSQFVKKDRKNFFWISQHFYANWLLKKWGLLNPAPPCEAWPPPFSWGKEMYKCIVQTKLNKVPRARHSVWQEPGMCLWVCLTKNPTFLWCCWAIEDLKYPLMTTK